MLLKRFFINILIRIILIILCCFFFVRFLNNLNDEYLFSVIVIGALIIVQVYLLVMYVNRINNILGRFFSTVTYEDSSVVYMKADNTSTFKEIYTYLDKIGNVIQMARLETEKHDLYLQHVIDHISVGLISFNMKFEVELFNRAARNLLQCEHLNNLDDLDRIYPGLSAEINNLEPGKPKLISIVVNKEVLKLSLNLNIFKTEDETIKLVSLQNIVNELERNELESWQKLIRVLRHEIMNSISPVISLTTTISRYFKGADRITPKEPDQLDTNIITKTINGLNTIEETGNNLLEFVTRYRELTALPLPRMSHNKIGTLLEKLKPLMMEMISKTDIDLQIGVHPEDLTLIADEKQIEQVLINLVKNAAEALRGNENGIIRIHAFKNRNERILIEIMDNGPGITQEDINHIFIPFFSTREGGSGIGLSLSRQIMQMHGGIISVQSNPGKETLFTLFF